MRTMLAFMTVLVLMVSTVAAAEEVPVISTSGQATVYVVPDKVVVLLGVQTFDASLDKAKAANESASGQLVKAVRAAGVNQSDIGTDQLSVEIRYKDTHNYTDIEGYFVRRIYSVTIKDVKLVEPLVDTALKNGANLIGDISFQSTELRKYRDQAREMAIRAAKEKAVALARVLDCTVGKPRNITESSGGYYGSRASNRNSNAQVSVQQVGGGGDSGETLPLGKIAVEATVSVTFELK